MQHFNEIITNEPSRCLKNNSAGPGSIRIAIVEDDLADFFLLGKKLDEVASFIDSFALFHSIEDLEKAQDASFDVIMLNRELGTAQGGEKLIRDIRQLHKRAGIIMYSGLVTPDIRIDALKEGAFAVVQKGTLRPFEMEALLKAAALVGWQVAPSH